MRFLLDTHVLLWWLDDDPRLSDAHFAILEDGVNDVSVSSISIAEASLKSSLGKLELAGSLDAMVTSGGFRHLPFESRHAVTLGELPWHHRDPFDRMLIAQAITDGLVFLTSDARSREYDVTTR